jgi:hypothetical protein
VVALAEVAAQLLQDFQLRSDSTPSATVCSDRSRAMLMMARISLMSASLRCSSETKERSIFSTSKRKLRR